MVRIAIILMLIAVQAHGQWRTTGNGKRVTSGTGYLHKTPVYVASTPEEPSDWDGNVWYVSTSGSNGNTGASTASPWRTLTHAMSASSGVAAGDSIYVKAGNYGAEEVIFAVSGTATDRIIIQGYKATPGDSPKDDWDYGDAHIASEMPYFANSTRESGEAFHFSQQEYITVNNIQTYLYQFAAWIDGGHNRLENWYCTEIGRINSAGTSSGIHLRGSKDSIWSQSTWYYDSDSSYLKNITIVNSTGEGVWVWSDYDTLIDVKVYHDDYSTGTNSATDYSIVMTGRNTYVYDCYVEAKPSILGSNHGIGVRSGWLIPDDPTRGPSYNKIVDCEVRNMDNDAIYFRHPDVHHNTAQGCKMIQCSYSMVIGDHSYSNVFDDCWADSANYGVTFWDGSERGSNGAGYNNTFQNCLVTNSNSAIRLEVASYTTDCDNNKFYNCTFNNNLHLFNGLNLPNSGNVVTNCIISSTSNVYASRTYTDNFVYTYTAFYNNGFSPFVGVGNLSVNPLYTDAANNDFTLQEGSDCIDAGIDVGLSYNGTAPDMGAIEYESLPWWLVLVLIPITIKRIKHEKRKNILESFYRQRRGSRI